MKELFQCRLFHDGGRDEQELGLLRFYDNGMCSDSGSEWVRWEARNGGMYVEDRPGQKQDMTCAVEEIQVAYDEYIAAVVNKLIVGDDQ